MPPLRFTSINFLPVSATTAQLLHNYSAQPMSKERRIPAFFLLHGFFSKFDTRCFVGWVTGGKDLPSDAELLLNAYALG